MPLGNNSKKRGREREGEGEGERDERDSDDTPLPTESPSTIAAAASPTTEGGAGGASTTNFRNVSACNRCRNRKNRCDQKLPKCTNCDKANVRCVGFDPVSKREIPRSYVYYLETRVNNLEAILARNSIAFPPPSQDFAISDAIKPGVNVPFPIQDEDALGQQPAFLKPEPAPALQPALDPALQERDDGERLEKLVNNIGMVSVKSRADPKIAAATSGISFARVVFAAVKKSVSGTQPPTPSEKGSKAKLSPSEAAAGGTTMRDSFFGLHTKPTIKPAPFPDKDLAHRLTDLYFEHANPQIPVLHRGEFMSLFERVYATDSKKRTPRELYMLNIVFAIGSGIIMDSSSTHFSTTGSEHSLDGGPPSKKKQRVATQQYEPEEYHSSAIIHLESFLGSSPATEGVGGGLEELQAVLLLAGLALLRPVAPGLWYIIGVAVRLSIDLGLHFEDIDHELDHRPTHPDTGDSISNGLGRKQWTRDLRRRLWWCVFNLDRLVSSCVGRPVSINEAVVTTEFPSMLDDCYITPSGFRKSPDLEEIPSYKLVSRHYIRLRLIQSEILQVLQHRQADQAREMGAHQSNAFVPSALENPFVRRFRSFREWRAYIDLKLWEWKESAPQPFETGVAFNPLFLELNYWQAVIMLYRQSLSVPEPLAGELSPATGDDVQSPGSLNQELEEDKQMVFLKVAQAGQTVLKIYRQLHRLKLVSYTFLATHHLFMSGISFLYAIWHSTLVRSQLTIDDVDFTVLAATSVLSDLMETCPPAEACRDAFVRMSKATISMVMSTTGFGNLSTLSTQPLNRPDGYFSTRTSNSSTLRMPDESTAATAAALPRRPLPKFDMNLKDLFSEEEIASRPLTHQPRLQDFIAANNPMPVPPPSVTPPQTSPRSTSSNTSPFQPPPSHPAYHPFATPAPQQSYDPTDFSFDNLDFLNDFPLPELQTGSSSIWGHHAGMLGDGDLGFGGGSGSTSTAAGIHVGGGTNGFDGSGAWEANGELFDSFFFGNSGNLY